MKMDTSLLQNNLPVTFIDHRSNLYYNKYQYRARLRLTGLNRTWYAKTLDEYKDRIKEVRSWDPSDVPKIRKDLDNVDMDAIGRYIDWRNIYFTPPKKSDKKVLIRIESSVAAVFSNDLSILQTLETINGTDSVDYSSVDTSMPAGVKYFVNEPKYNYRIYFKSKRTDEKFRDNLCKFIDRYKSTDTVIIPSPALKVWLNDDTRHKWYNRFCSSHYFLDYNDESVSTLIGLMFGDMVKNRFKLEKRPEE